MQATNQLDFFISYTQTDRAWAEWIAWQLQVAGWKVRLQAWHFRPGEGFIQHMQAAATEASHILAVYSPEYFSSGFAGSEWQSALAIDPVGSGRRLIPVRVRPCSPPGLLAQLIYIDLVGATEEEARADLLSGIRGDATPSTAPPYPGEDQAISARAPAYPGDEPSRESLNTVVHSRGVPCYANKYEMPGSFWRDLSARAEQRFILIGRTNKSWISRSDNQSRRFASDLLRVIHNGGTVAILSDKQKAVQKSTIDFLRRFLLPLAGLSATQMATKLSYCVTGRIHYQAVVSDDTLVVLPLLNSDAFRQEAIVLEIDKRMFPKQFSVYLEDILRLLRDATSAPWLEGI